MFRNEILISASLQSFIIQIVHEGDQGITHTKQCLRTKDWWPGLNKSVEDST